LIGKSLFECHNEKSKEKIIKAIDRLKNNGPEIFLTVNDRNDRMYITPVRDESGELINSHLRERSHN
jgi:hypothetical protein